MSISSLICVLKEGWLRMGWLRASGCCCYVRTGVQASTEPAPAWRVQLRSGRIFFLFHIKLFDSGASFPALQISRINALMQREVRVQLRQAELQTLNTQSSRSRGRRRKRQQEGNISTRLEGIWPGFEVRGSQQRKRFSISLDQQQDQDQGRGSWWLQCKRRWCWACTSRNVLGARNCLLLLLQSCTHGPYPRPPSWKSGFLGPPAPGPTIAQGS
jgi:hypothetical protein